MKYSILLFIAALFSCNAKQTEVVKAEVQLPAKVSAAELEKSAKATFAGGCFWCIEAVFERVEGVQEAVSGYTAGQTKNPTYRDVGNGITGHTEAVEIYYDPAVISYTKLVEIFFASHDPTQLNRQGPDVGTQYRSGAYYRTDEEKAIIDKHVAYLEKSGKYTKPIVTEIAALDIFYIAEDYHQDYYEHHPENSYVRNVSKPKVEKFMKQFPDVLKAAYKK